MVEVKASFDFKGTAVADIQILKNIFLWFVLINNLEWNSTAKVSNLAKLIYILN